MSDVDGTGAKVGLGVTVEPETHDDGGKQTHCGEPDVICCKHGHDAIEQFVVKQPPKYINHLIFRIVFHFCFTRSTID
jgi:hypothetical protein